MSVSTGQASQIHASTISDNCAHIRRLDIKLVLIRYIVHHTSLESIPLQSSSHLLDTTHQELSLPFQDNFNTLKSLTHLWCHQNNHLTVSTNQSLVKSIFIQSALSRDHMTSNEWYKQRCHFTTQHSLRVDNTPVLDSYSTLPATMATTLNITLNMMPFSTVTLPKRPQPAVSVTLSGGLYRPHTSVSDEDCLLDLSSNSRIPKELEVR